MGRAESMVEVDQVQLRPTKVTHSSTVPLAISVDRAGQKVGRRLPNVPSRQPDQFTWTMTESGDHRARQASDNANPSIANPIAHGHRLILG